MDKLPGVLARYFSTKDFAEKNKDVEKATGSRASDLGVSLGAGLLGAFVLTLRYALRPSAKPKLPGRDLAGDFCYPDLLYQSRAGSLPRIGARGPLVFLHGVYVGASSYEWLKLYPHFAGTHQVLAVDLLGFGESERPDVPMSATDHVQALVEFIQGEIRRGTSFDSCQRLWGRVCSRSSRATPGPGPTIGSFDAGGASGIRPTTATEALRASFPGCRWQTGLFIDAFFRRGSRSGPGSRTSALLIRQKSAMKRSRFSPTSRSNSAPKEQFFNGCRGDLIWIWKKDWPNCRNP